MNLATLNLQQESNEVFRSTADVSVISSQHIELIRQQAKLSSRKRARICLHPNNDSIIHEMFIALADRGYVRPHRHLNKSESFHLVDGDIGVVLFDHQGSVTDVIRLSKSHNLFYRSEPGIFHTVVVLSEIAVIHEVTSGPFNLAQTEYAGFAPQEGSKEVDAYLTFLIATINQTEF